MILSQSQAAATVAYLRDNPAEQQMQFGERHTYRNADGSIVVGTRDVRDEKYASLDDMAAAYGVGA